MSQAPRPHRRAPEVGKSVTISWISHILALLFQRLAMETDKSITHENLLLDNNTVAVSAKASQETVDEGVVACNTLSLPIIRAKY